MKGESTPEGQMLIYRDGGLKMQVRLDGQTVWLTQAQMADLYQTSKQNISLHIQNILDDKELPAEAVVKEYLTTAADGKNYCTLHYSLDMILAVGYRVRSPRGTLFRQWATTRLRELLVKGFTLDDERIKAGRTSGADYFDELLARIRDVGEQALRWTQPSGLKREYELRAGDEDRPRLSAAAAAVEPARSTRLATTRHHVRAASPAGR